MKRIFSILTSSLTRTMTVAAFLGIVVAAQACGPYGGDFRVLRNPETDAHFASARGKGITLHCPTVGLGDQFPTNGCPSGYCSRQVSLKSPALDHKGGKIYFCCGGCVAAFKKTPEKFAANANHQLVATGQAQQIMCPISGDKMALSCGFLFTSKVAEINIHFSTKAAKDKVDQAKPAQQLEMVFGNAAFAKAF